jgi:hypothetical protein
MVARYLLRSDHSIFAQFFPISFLHGTVGNLSCRKLRPTGMKGRLSQDADRMFISLKSLMGFSSAGGTNQKIASGDSVSTTVE